MTDLRTWSILTVLGCCAAPILSQTSHPKAKLLCEALVGYEIPASKIGLPTTGARVTAASVNQGQNVAPPNFVPPYCKIVGTISPVDPKAETMQFGIDIPLDWNGSVIQMAGTGAIPNLAELQRGFAPGAPLGPMFPPDSEFPISQGYAVYGGDGGHKGPDAPDPHAVPDIHTHGITYVYALPGSGAAGATHPTGPHDPHGLDWWANEEILHNFAGDYVKKTHDVVFNILHHMYGVTPDHSMFMGESQGARAGLVAAVTTPKDYDGILAAVPVVYFTGMHVARYDRIKVQMNPGSYVPLSKVPAISREVIRQCDALDGLSDGVINNYYACNKLFDPSQTPHPLAALRCPNGVDTFIADCLSDKQIAAVDAWHAPLHWGFAMPNGELYYPGIPAGGELRPGWVALIAEPNLNQPSIYEGISDPTLEAKYNDPEKYSLLFHDYKTLETPIRDIAKLMDVAPELTEYMSHGGKLILYTAAIDQQASPRAVMQYYEEMEKRSGKDLVKKQVRYYVAPDVDHGSVGVSATTGIKEPRYADLVGALEDWVMKGRDPVDGLPMTLKEETPPFTTIRSKPLCLYPEYPRYKGEGDPDKMESYACTLP